jgi:hypothetical protein
MKNYMGTINGDKILNKIESFMKYFPNIPSTYIIEKMKIIG